MIANDYTGYGMRDGKLLFIEDVPRGLGCGCVCARCGQMLVAKKGSVRQHHFSHFAVTSCHGVAETVLHLLAKELISEMDVFVVPQYLFVKQRRTKTGTLVRNRTIVAKGGTFKIHAIRVEESEGDFVPDIIIETGSKSLIVEVAVTHKVAGAKLRKIRHRDLPAIEIRLDPGDSFLSRESLKDKLQRDLTSKFWLFHPAQREAERTFIAKFRKLIAHGRTKLRQSAKPPSFAPLPTLPPPSYKHDRMAEEFYKMHRRYPTAEECLKLSPELWKPYASSSEQSRFPRKAVHRRGRQSRDDGA
jgi:hypothetical protein